jgi:hypothetical protein
MSKKTSKLALMMIVIGLAMMLLPGAAQAQVTDEAPAIEDANSFFLDADGAGNLGGAIGAGLVIMGVGAGIGRIGANAVEAMARLLIDAQPDRPSPAGLARPGRPGGSEPTAPSGREWQ